MEIKTTTGIQLNADLQGHERWVRMEDVYVELRKGRVSALFRELDKVMRSS